MTKKNPYFSVFYLIYDSQINQSISVFIKHKLFIGKKRSINIRSIQVNDVHSKATVPNWIHLE